MFALVLWIRPAPLKHIPRAFPVVAIAFFLLFALVSLLNLRAKAFSADWVVAVGREVIFIQLAGCVDDEVIAAQSLKIVPADVSSIRQIKLRRIMPGPDGRAGMRGASAEDRVCLEMLLKENVDGAALDVIEAARDYAARRVVGNEPPVALAEDRLLRICWRAPRRRLTPSIEEAVKILSGRFPMVPTLSECEDFTAQTLENLPEADQDSKLRSLAKISPNRAALARNALRSVGS